MEARTTVLKLRFFFSQPTMGDRIEVQRKEVICLSPHNNSMTKLRLKWDCGLQWAEIKMQHTCLSCQASALCSGPVQLPLELQIWICLDIGGLVWSPRCYKVTDPFHLITSTSHQEQLSFFYLSLYTPQPGGLWRGNTLGWTWFSRLAHNYTSGPAKIKPLWLCFHLGWDNRGYQIRDAFNFQYPSTCNLFLPKTSLPASLPPQWEKCLFSYLKTILPLVHWGSSSTALGLFPSSIFLINFTLPHWPFPNYI